MVDPRLRVNVWILPAGLRTRDAMVFMKFVKIEITIGIAETFINSCHNNQLVSSRSMVTNAYGANISDGAGRGVSELFRSSIINAPYIRKWA